VLLVAAMTMPRPIVPGRTYLVTRRVTQRQLWLKPTKLTRACFHYCVAVAQKRSGVRLHALVCMSNHYHAVVTDVAGKLPKFTYWLHKYLARAINTWYGRGENLWDNRQPNHVLLGDAGAVIKEIGYTLANPSHHDLLEHSREWPGPRTRLRDLLGTEEVCSRPATYFKEDGDMPDVATLRIDRPDLTSHLTDRDYIEHIARSIGEHEAKARAERRSTGKRVLGIARILAARPGSTPGRRNQRRQLVPRVACNDPVERRRLLAELGEFLGLYRRALALWRAGHHGVTWPPGTYQMRLLHSPDTS